jgi:hypothetical protein
MSLGRNACDGRLVASVHIVHARLRGLTRQRTPFAPSVVSLSTWVPGRVVHTAFHAHHWTKRNPGWKLMTLREKVRWSINHSTPGVGRDSCL